MPKTALKDPIAIKRRIWSHYKKKYNHSWEDLPEYKGWLQKSPYNEMAFCSVCKRELRAQKNDLSRHANTEKHKRNVLEYFSNKGMVEENNDREMGEQVYVEDCKPQVKKVSRLLTKIEQREMSTEKTNESNISSAESHRYLDLETLKIIMPKPFVMQVELNRPERLNAFNHQMWLDIKKCFDNLATDPDCRVVVITGAGKHFTAGIDLMGFVEKGKQMIELDDVARKAALLEVMIKEYQDAISSLELCPKPVICAIHSACVGAGVDLVTAADIRYCSKDAFFQVKEVDVGLAADVGTLQRLPKAVSSQSLARELCFTARRLMSDEALSCGLVNRTFPDRDAVIAGALEVAESIANKSPVAVQATKQNIIYSLSRPNQDGLDHIRLINKLNLQSDDFATAATAGLTKETPTFSKL